MHKAKSFGVKIMWGSMIKDELQVGYSEILGQIQIRIEVFMEFLEGEILATVTCL